MYVWNKPGDGRVPLHFCSLPDGTDPLFDRSLAHVRSAAAMTLKVQSIQRKVSEAHCYVYPEEVRVPLTGTGPSTPAR